jgi:hypothetical protein
MDKGRNVVIGYTSSNRSACRVLQISKLEIRIVLLLLSMRIPKIKYIYISIICFQQQAHSTHFLINRTDDLIRLTLQLTVVEYIGFGSRNFN